MVGKEDNEGRREGGRVKGKKERNRSKDGREGRLKEAKSKEEWKQPGRPGVEEVKTKMVR